MPAKLPSAEVMRKFLDESFDASTPVLQLRWSEPVSSTERLWELPQGLSILCTPPRQFGLHLRRFAADGYAVRVVWERTHLSWPALSRMELLGSSLSALLGAVGLDLWAMLEGPISAARPRARAA